MTVSIEDEDTGGVLDEWMTRSALARELGVSIDTLGRWESRRIGPPSIRVGRKVLYRRETVREWLREQEDRKRGAFQRTSGGRR